MSENVSDLFTQAVKDAAAGDEEALQKTLAKVRAQADE